jgi:RimJ/RimL family protein N-acetyltransferase
MRSSPSEKRMPVPDNTTHITLRPFIEPDIPLLISWITSPRLLLQWAGPGKLTYPLTEDQLRPFLSIVTVDNVSHVAYTAHTDDGTVCGHIQLGAIDARNQTASLCRVMIAPNARGRGCCVPMVNEALGIGFQDLELRRVQLQVYSFNTPALHCYAAAGFVQEGVLRKSLLVGEELWDTVIMGILREEWISKR